MIVVNFLSDRMLSPKILSTAFFHPHFIILIFPSTFLYPPSVIRHPSLSGPHFTETLLKKNFRSPSILSKSFILTRLLQHTTKLSLLVEKQKDFSRQKCIDSQPEKSLSEDGWGSCRVNFFVLLRSPHRRKKQREFCWYIKFSQWKGEIWI